MPMAMRPLAAKLGGILSESLWMAVSLLVYQTIRLVDILILAAFTSPREVGAYTRHEQRRPAHPDLSHRRLANPRPRDSARLPQYHDLEAIKRALQTYLRRATLMGGYLLGGVAIFGADLGLVFGHGFSFPWPLPVLLGFGWFVSATLAPFGYVMSMTGRHRRELVILLGGALLLVACLLILVPRYAGIGAALSVAIAFLAVNAVRCLYVIRIIGRNPLHISNILPPAAFLAAAFACRQAALALVPQTLLNLILECTLYTIIAAVIFAGLLATREERQTLNRVLRPLTGMRKSHADTKTKHT